MTSTKSNKIFQFIIYCFLPFISFSQSNSKHNYKAVALNTKAYKMLISGGTSEFSSGGKMLTGKELSEKVLKILDSATTLDPYYNSAYLNKISSLIILKKYNSAINTLQIVIKNSPTDYLSYLKKGVIYNTYLKKKFDADKAFKKAYDIAYSNTKKHTVLLSERSVAIVLSYYKGMQTATNYLSSVASFYKKKEEKNGIIALIIIIKQENQETKVQQLFDGYSTY